MIKRAYTLLRSRKLAIALIGLFAVYASVSAIIADAGDYAAPYTNPLFFVLSVALALSTAACSWERTIAAVRLWRSSTPQGLAERVRTHPQLAIQIDGEAGSAIALESAAIGMASLGLSVRRGADRFSATSPRIGLVGSPLFHWSLVLLFVFIGLGQLTRSEGLIGIPVGSSVTDSRAAYGTVDEGPLHAPGFTGLTFRVPEMTLQHVVNGVNVGAAPVVEVYDGAELIVRHRTYPNSPLRYRSLLMHVNDYGLAAGFQLEGDGAPVAAEVLYDFTEGAGSADDVAGIEVTKDGVASTFTSSVQLDRAGSQWLWDVPANPRVSWTMSRGDEVTSGVLAVGDGVALGDGHALRLVKVARYARLSVVDDWSVTPIYVLFVLAAIGLSLALLIPHRAVWVILVEKDGQLSLHAKTRQSRGDRTFPDAAEEALRQAVSGKDEG